MKVICFDLDGVICSNTWGQYENAQPFKKIIDKINKLYDEGYIVKIFTARFMSRNNENVENAYKMGYEFTKSQIDRWGLKYHKLIMGKPSYDIIIDDKSIDYDENWINKTF
mgnify:CR=1 FL=1